jgi:hypothetical protein
MIFPLMERSSRSFHSWKDHLEAETNGFPETRNLFLESNGKKVQWDFSLITCPSPVLGLDWHAYLSIHLYI